MQTARQINALSVLIVDDDPVFSALAEAFLLDAGCVQVEVAESGEEGVRRSLADAEKHGLILLDLNMPGFDGLSAMRLLADKGYHGAVAIVSGEKPAIVQASANLANLHGLRLAGVLSKPLRADELKAALSAATEGQRKRRQPAPADTGVGQAVRLMAVYQPKVRLADKGIHGAEALMRVVLENGRVLPPVDYLARMTQTGELGGATIVFLETVLDDIKSWKGAAAARPVSINVPATLLEEESFMELFAEKVRRKGVAPQQITVEMTEAALPGDMSRLLEVMTRLRMAGFGLAIDDYGTGMANYDILRQCPFTELKIDRSVAQAATHDELACGFIGNCVSIGRALSMKVVAEGVETAEQAEAMRRLGVDVIQGYFFSKPLQAAEYAAVLAAPEASA